MRDEVELQAAGEAAFATLIRPPAEFTAFPAGHLKLTGAPAARLKRIGLTFLAGSPVLYAGKLIGIEWKKRGDAVAVTLGADRGQVTLGRGSGGVPSASWAGHARAVHVRDRGAGAGGAGGRGRSDGAWRVAA